MILDHNGTAVPEKSLSKRCPKCGALEKHWETFNSFGGYTKTVCTKCGETITSGKVS